MTEYTRALLIEEWKSEYLSPSELEKLTVEDYVEGLEQYQGRVIAVGELIEQTSHYEEHELVIHELEQYCEDIYNLSGLISDKAAFANGIVNLAESHNRIAKLMGDFAVKRLAVFMPYKYSMWDSLESIYYAAANDPEWDAVIMPIPYADLKDDGSVEKWNYEGSSFAAFDIREYNIDYVIKTHPDAIYLHNPYDDHNNVTQVDSDFFSENLKKYTDRLVYVPYFFAGEIFPDVHCGHMSYNNFDYIVVPSEYSKGQIANYVPSEKILAFGSPKIDYMIKLGNERVMPKEWEVRIRGRKAVLYNISLGAIINQRFNAILKMRQVFNYFKKNQDMVLWWRPHPLIKSTLKSNCPELLGAYEEMEKAYLLENIGIYDLSADSNRAVACTDAFMGNASSMQNLFGIMGKPIFIINDYVYDEPDEEDKRILFMWLPAMAVDDKSENWRSYNQGANDGALIFYDSYSRTLYRLNPDTKEVSELKRLDWDIYSLNVLHADNAEEAVLKVYPRFSTDPVLTYKINGDSWAENSDNPVCGLKFEEHAGIISRNNRTILLPGRCPDIIMVDEESGQVNSYKWKTDYLSQFCAYPNEPLIASSIMVGSKLYMLSMRTNLIIVFDTDARTFTYHLVGEDNVRFANMWYENKTGSIWLVAWDGSCIVRWQLRENICNKYDINVPGFYPRLSSFSGSDRPAFMRIAWWRDEMILTPALANMFLKVDINTGVVSKWDVKLPFEIGQRKGTCFADANNLGWGTFTDDTHMLVQSSYDGSMVEIDLETDETSLFKLLRPDDSVLKMTASDRNLKSDGGCYVFNEDAVHFNFTDMMNFFAKATDSDLLSERQHESSSKGIENADGSCGQKIHEYIKDTF